MGCVWDAPVDFVTIGNASGSTFCRTCTWIMIETCTKWSGSGSSAPPSHALARPRHHRRLSLIIALPAICALQLLDTLLHLFLLWNCVFTGLPRTLIKCQEKGWVYERSYRDIMSGVRHSRCIWQYSNTWTKFKSFNCICRSHTNPHRIMSSVNNGCPANPVTLLNSWCARKSFNLEKKEDMFTYKI